MRLDSSAIEPVPQPQAEFCADFWNKGGADSDKDKRGNTVLRTSLPRHVMSPTTTSVLSIVVGTRMCTVQYSVLVRTRISYLFIKKSFGLQSEALANLFYSTVWRRNGDLNACGGDRADSTNTRTIRTVMLQSIQTVGTDLCSVETGNL